METFERIEKKFWMEPEQYRSICEVLDGRMTEDAFGESIVLNIYYDTKDYALIRRSIERPDFKEKIRLRSYGIPKDDSPVFVELKRKKDGIGYKRRLTVPYRDALRLLRGERIGSDQKQVEEEILKFVSRYHPEPKVILTYRRKAYFLKDDPTFRVTFDRDLRYKRYKDSVAIDEYGKPMMEDMCKTLMEIKTSTAIPLWLIRAMSEHKIYQSPFSKVGTCYSRHLVYEEEKENI